VGEKGEGDGYGIGSDTAYTIATIAEMIAIKGPRPVIEFIPERPGNRMMGEVRTSKTKALGWVEKGNLMNYIMELDLCV
jgi:UDP-glucose 4-epimerase